MQNNVCIVKLINTYMAIGNKLMRCYQFKYFIHPSIMILEIN